MLSLSLSLKINDIYDAFVEEDHSIYMWNIFDIIDSFELTTAPTNKQYTWGCKLLDILLSAIGVQYHETLDVNHVISSIKRQQKFHREFAIFLQLLSTVVKIQRMKGTASDSWYGQLFRFSISCCSFYSFLFALFLHFFCLSRSSCLGYFVPPSSRGNFITAFFFVNSRTRTELYSRNIVRNWRVIFCLKAIVFFRHQLDCTLEIFIDVSLLPLYLS